MSKLFSASIIAKPHFELTLNKDSIDLLHRGAKHHYDRKCREAAAQGGFLWGWMNCVDFGVTCGASLRELDLTLKILENFCGSLDDARLSLEYITVVKELLEKSHSFKDHTIKVGSD